jgi:outer membrane protein OmpA-like peptidoglycan-associated protein
MLAPLHAQETGIPRFEFGPLAGLGYGLQSGEFIVRGGQPTCGTFSGGRVIGQWYGGVAQWQQLLGDRLGLELRAGYSRSNSRYTAPPTDEQRVVDTVTHTLEVINREFRLDAAFDAAIADILVRWRATERIGISGGVAVGWRFRKSFRQTDNVLDPNRSFAGGERTLAMDVGQSFTMQRLALGGVVSMEYALPLWPRASLVPNLTLRGDILPAVEEPEWRGISLSAGAALLFDLTRRTDTTVPPPPPPDTIPTPKIPELDVAIAMHGVDETGTPAQEAVVSVREVIFRKETPLLPVVYFDHASDSIPARYTRMTPPETARFAYRSLAELDPVELSHAVLNLVGYRMRENRDAKLTLYGLTSSDEGKPYAYGRAESVRNYLVDVWGIGKSRIEIRVNTGPMPASDDATADGRSENRRVLFASSSTDLLAPIATERVVRDFNPPLVKLDPTINAEAGVRQWSITVHQGTDTLATFINGMNERMNSDLSWRLQDERIDSALGRLVAVLSVEDSTGQLKKAFDSIDLRLRRDSTIVRAGQELRGETERLAYSLVAFGYSSATGDRSHEVWLEDLAAMLRPGARIEIRGYTDRIGDDSYNLELSRGRAQYVADRLRALAAQHGVTNLSMDVQGAGVDNSGRFPNNLPEGRVLSRGATIVAEQPLKKNREP